MRLTFTTVLRHLDFAALAQLLREVEGIRATLVSAALGLVLTGLLLPIFSQVFIDGYLADGPSLTLAGLVALMIAAGLLRAGLSLAVSRGAHAMQVRYATRSSTRTTRRFLDADPAWVARYGAGDLAAVVRQNDRLARRLLSEVIPAFLDLMAVPVLFLVMAAFDVRLALAALLLTGVNALVLRTINARQTPIGDQVGLARGRMAQALTDSLSAIAMLRATSLENQTFTRWATRHETYHRQSLRLGRLSEILAAGPAVISGITTALTLGLGAVLILDGSLTPGAFVACQTLLFGINDPIRRFVDLSTAIQDLSADWRRREALLAEGRPPTNRVRATRGQDAAAVPDRPPPGPGARLTIPQPVDGPAARRVGSLALEGPGVIAIAGAPEGPRTRFCRTLAGLMPADTGPGPGVTVDGRPVAALSPFDRLGTVALLERHATVFSASVRDNLTLWDATVPDAALWRVLRRADLAEVIGARPDGLDTPLAEGGRNLSGGQRQRLALARVLLHDPRVLVINGALEPLESRLARHILAGLRRDGLLVLVASTRREVLAACDDAVIVEPDRIRAAGRWHAGGTIELYT
ncbi:ABC transporter transmembrane domain-containing protein [Roseospira visakhapatnamensis]|uniref:ABC-type bacteriocin/lantibiotic exporter with double-glycine peptidase domain n=1 Tax=Roseospira visakhapatnamensis TaxID=390880 RepID=A0A7W6RF93_9PROT|nr:ABC transporter transmembrane domain-containing protein [Roseospira visakhapatnamensis]MBB4267398.1 ABC-type bacteriocin/lantibiotic exporter with double-glycine peptidase domain [Roseospira visakhapatnamensis]